MKHFYIPKHLTPVRAINVSKVIQESQPEDDFVYDFNQMQKCHPFGLLVIAAAIRNNIKRYPASKHTPIGTSNTQGGQFASTFGFYQSCGFDIGFAKEEFDTGYRYIPIKEITARQLHAEYTDTLVLNEKVNRHAGSLASMMVGDLSKNVRETVQYCFREIMRNTFEHAETDSLWVCGQYWPTRDEAEIAILDGGIGILKSLQSNCRIKAETCFEANSLSLQPGLTRTLGMKVDPNNIWQNSGYGLYVASTLCAITGGYFLLSSGDSALLVSGKTKTQVNFDANQIGTAVCLNIKTKAKDLFDFDRTLKAIVSEGEAKASENSERRIISASKVTTIASMLRHIENSVQESAPSVPNCAGEIPLNEKVLFRSSSVTAQGEILGTFSYNGKQFNGSLLNVNCFNRKKYVNEKQVVSAVVRKCKGTHYVLFELSYYERLNKKR